MAHILLSEREARPLLVSQALATTLLRDCRPRDDPADLAAFVNDLFEGVTTMTLGGLLDACYRGEPYAARLDELAYRPAR